MQVSFRSWVQGAVWDVVAMYEDRHEVVVVGPAATLLRQSVPFKRTKVRGDSRRESSSLPSRCFRLMCTKPCSQSMQEHAKRRIAAKVCVIALKHMTKCLRTVQEALPVRSTLLVPHESHTLKL